MDRVVIVCVCVWYAHILLKAFIDINTHICLYTYVYMYVCMCVLLKRPSHAFNLNYKVISRQFRETKAQS